MKRILRTGADAYVLADSMEELARKIAPRPDPVNADNASVPARELPSTTTVDELVAAFLRESVEYSTRLRSVISGVADATESRHTNCTECR